MHLRKQGGGNRVSLVGITLGAAACLVLVLAWLAPTPCLADLGRLVRGIARVSDDVPIRKLDDVAASPRMRRAARELIEEAGTHSDDVLRRTKAVRRALEQTLSSIESPSLRRQFLEDIARLDLPSQEAALVLARGSKRLGDVVPDIAMRTRLLRDGGGELLASLGRFEDLGEDALKFDVAVNKGILRSPPGMRNLTSEDFGRFFLDQGKRAHHFWTEYVRPHWQLWLAGTALAAVMLAPDEFLDAAGNLTEQGIRKVGKLGGEVLASALAGTIHAAGEGAKQIVRETTQDISRTFFGDVWGILTFALLVVVAVVAVPFPRRYCIGILSRIFGLRRHAAATNDNRKENLQN
ncbi:MAG: hypothetical protein ACUVQR_09060 [Thermogutta sp.]